MDNIASRDKNTDLNIANRDNSVSKSIADRDKTTDLNIANRDKSVETSITNKEADLAKRITISEYNNALAEAGADVFNTIYEEPILFGTNEGSAWIDSWGTRGLDIKVKRCSTATEKLAGNTFYRYGYRTSDLWIDQPTLNLMKFFTYWEAKEAWVIGDKINETNKELIRRMFHNGVTVWRAPEYVMNIDITNNTLK